MDSIHIWITYHLNSQQYVLIIFLSVCDYMCVSISACFYLVLISVEKFLQKRAPSTALQNSESTVHIIKNFSLAAPLKQNYYPFSQ